MSIIIQSVLRRLLNKRTCRNCGRELTEKEASRGDLCSRCRDREKNTDYDSENNSQDD